MTPLFPKDIYVIPETMTLKDQAIKEILQIIFIRAGIHKYIK